MRINGCDVVFMCKGCRDTCGYYEEVICANGVKQCKYEKRTYDNYELCTNQSANMALISDMLVV